MGYLGAALGKIAEFEGASPWMYRDTVGRVTVAVGLMLPDAEAAMKLPFLVGGAAAGAEAIAAEFARVDAMPMGRPALFYRRAGGPELSTETVDGLLRTVVEGLDQTLAGRLPGFEAMPDGVKMALLDMGYNLGTEGLLEGYPKMIRAVEAGDWSRAAAGCFRHGPGAARNAWTKEMFLENVVGTMKAVGEGRLKRLGYGVVGMVASWMGK